MLEKTMNQLKCQFESWIIDRSDNQSDKWSYRNVADAKSNAVELIQSLSLSSFTFYVC